MHCPQEFEDKATEFDLCVAQTIEVTLSTNPAVILSRLRQMSSARMVIVILQYAQILTVNRLLGLVVKASL